MKSLPYRLLVFILLIVLIAEQGAFTRQSPKTATGRFYPVARIVDGDTFWINNGSVKGLKIRLIGIDAPESRNSGRKTVNRYGKDASRYLTGLIGGKKVRLEFDVDRFDRYGRTLAYVYLENGIFVNADLVRNGYATVMTIPPNVKYSDTFVRLARRARNQHKGLWQENDNQLQDKK